jgi:hypothetical protein
VFSGNGVVVMGTVMVTMFHPRGLRDLELPPLPEVVLPYSEDSLRTVCKYGDPLCIIPMNTAHDSSPSGKRLRRSKRLVVNSRLPKQMVSPGVRPTLVGLLWLAMKVSFGE